MNGELDPLREPKIKLSVLGGVVVVVLLAVFIPRVFVAFSKESAPLSSFTWDLNGIASIRGIIIGACFVLFALAIAIAIFFDFFMYAKSTRPLEKQLSEVEADTTPDVPDENGRTPLMKAAGKNDFKKVLALIKGGADVNAQDKFGHTALSYAKKLTNEKREISFNHIINVLLKAGARE